MPAIDRENLRIGTCEVDRESPTSVEIRVTARYKPEDGSEFETDRWGYTETDPLPALRISDLSEAEAEADLIEAFVPVAIDETVRSRLLVRRAESRRFSPTVGAVDNTLLMLQRKATADGGRRFGDARVA